MNNPPPTAPASAEPAQQGDQRPWVVYQIAGDLRGTQVHERFATREEADIAASSLGTYWAGTKLEPQLAEGERAAFEAWCVKRWGGDRGGDNFLRFETDGPYADQYRKGNVEFAWCAWRAALDSQAAELARLRAELLIRRKSGSASERLHNLCESIAADADGSEFSREEWERIDTENVELRKELAALRASAASVQKLATFGAWAAREFRDTLCDVDGGSAQEAMERFGVIEMHEVTEPCGEGCVCAEYDFPCDCYRFPHDISEAMAAALATKGEGA